MLTNLLIFFIHVCQVVELPLSHNRVWTDSTIVLQWLRKCEQAILLSTTEQRESRVLTGGQSLQHLSSTCRFSNTQGSSIVQGALSHEKWLEGPSLRCHSSQGNTNSQLKTNACCGECMLLFQRYWVLQAQALKEFHQEALRHNKNEGFG